MKTVVPKIAAWLALASIVFVTVSPISMRPSDFLPVNVDRALAFGLLSLLLVLAYPRHWRWTLVAAVIGPGAIELLQVFSPTRHAHLDDALVKASGAVIGVVIGTAISRLLASAKSARRISARQRALNRFSASASVRRVPVKSRMIESIHFSQKDGQLRICLSNGHQRLFEGVTENEAFAIAAAPSPGNYYVTEFKARHKRAA